MNREREVIEISHFFGEHRALLRLYGWISSTGAAPSRAATAGEYIHRYCRIELETTTQRLALVGLPAQGVDQPRVLALALAPAEDLARNAMLVRADSLSRQLRAEVSVDFLLDFFSEPPTHEDLQVFGIAYDAATLFGMLAIPDTRPDPDWLSETGELRWATSVNRSGVPRLDISLNLRHDPPFPSVCDLCEGTRLLQSVEMREVPLRDEGFIVRFLNLHSLRCLDCGTSEVEHLAAEAMKLSLRYIAERAEEAGIRIQHPTVTQLMTAIRPVIDGTSARGSD